MDQPRPKIVLPLLGAWAVSTVLVFGLGKSIGYNEAMSGERVRGEDAIMASNAERLQDQLRQINELRAMTQPTR